MPYTHYNTDERNALQAMEDMALPKSFMAVIPGKHLSGIYRQINRNRTDGVYTGNQAQALSVHRRLDAKSSPGLDDPALMGKIVNLFVKDLSADQIAGRLRVLYPDRKEKQASPSTIWRHIYQETAKPPLLQVHFRQKQAKPRHRKGHKTAAVR
jgi:IS30 family transposase